MYEVAPVATESVLNPFEANTTIGICAAQLPSIQEIMGQITSNHQQATPVSRHHSERKSKIYYRHSAVQPLRKEDLAILRDPIKNASIYRGSTRESTTTRRGIKDTSMQNGRPVTISEMNAYNIEKNDPAAVLAKNATKEIPKSDTTADPTASTGSTTTKTASSTAAAAAATSATSKRATLPNEFYNTVGDGYHKTDSCYYRSPDGGYHKLPSDSYHKMSEGCYVKVSDGSFKRLETSSTNPNGGDTQSTPSSSQTKMKQQMMKFLKRSKSHTPATMKELQKEKESRNASRGASDAPQGEKNRKVVVTMMENGGLPIVATSKAERTTKHKDSSSNRNKVSFTVN